MITVAYPRHERRAAIHDSPVSSSLLIRLVYTVFHPLFDPYLFDCYRNHANMPQAKRKIHRRPAVAYKGAATPTLETGWHTTTQASDMHITAYLSGGNISFSPPALLSSLWNQTRL